MSRWLGMIIRLLHFSSSLQIWLANKIVRHRAPLPQRKPLMMSIFDAPDTDQDGRKTKCTSPESYKVGSMTIGSWILCHDFIKYSLVAETQTSYFAFFIHEPLEAENAKTNSGYFPQVQKRLY